MKKLMIVLLALAIGVPAMAVDIGVIDNGDQTITVTYTAAAGENIRGVGVILTLTNCTVDAGADSAINAEFNVSMDAAYDAETASPGSYVIGSGSALATVGAAGALTGTANGSCSISLGVLDELGAQAAASAGTDVALVTIALNVDADATVTASADALRGGIVGDAVVAGSMAADVTVAGGVPDKCMMDTHPAYDRWIALGEPSCWCYQYQHAGDVDGLSLYSYYPVSADDLGIFVAAYMLAEASLAPEGICADLDHIALYSYYPVSSDDLGIFVGNYMAVPVSVNPDAAHYNFYTTP